MSNPVDQPKVSELRSRLQTARHMTGIPPAVDAIIEELFAALTPQATTVGDAAAKLGTLPRIISDLKAETDAHKHGSIRIDLDEVRTILSALIGIPGAEAAEEDDGTAYQEGFEDGRSEARGAAVELWDMVQKWAVASKLIEEPDSDGITAQELMDAILVGFGGRKPPRRAPPAPTSERVQALPAWFVRIDVTTANQIINDTLEEAAAIAKYGMERAQRDYRTESPHSHAYQMAEEIYDAIRALNHKSS